MEKEQALQALLDQVVRQGDFIGVSALYLRDGKQLAYAQAGMADRERGIPFARDTICRVFSMSKPITAFAVMKLWEDGKLDLDAPVAAYPGVRGCRAYEPDNQAAALHDLRVWLQ